MSGHYRQVSLHSSLLAQLKVHCCWLYVIITYCMDLNKSLIIENLYNCNREVWIYTGMSYRNCFENNCPLYNKHYVQWMYSCALTLQCFASNWRVWGCSLHEFLTPITCYQLIPSLGLVPAWVDYAVTALLRILVYCWLGWTVRKGLLK